MVEMSSAANILRFMPEAQVECHMQRRRPIRDFDIPTPTPTPYLGCAVIRIKW